MEEVLEIVIAELTEQSAREIVASFAGATTGQVARGAEWGLGFLLGLGATRAAGTLLPRDRGANPT